MINPLFFDIKPGERMLVTSDLHGWPALLRGLLDDAGYIPGKDWLFILGDTVEKGPDSLGAAREVYRLSRQKRVCVLRGNVDRWLGKLMRGSREKALSYNEFRPENTLAQAARKYGYDGVNADNIDDVRRRFNAESGDLLDFFDSLPVCAVAGDYVFSHSGLPADGSLDGEAEDFTRNYDFYRRRLNRTDKTVVHGHIPSYYLNSDTSYRPFFDDENRVIDIDGGTVSYALQVNMLMIADGRTEVLSRDPFERVSVTADVEGDMSKVVKILPDYDASRDNTMVEIIERGEDFSLVRCKTTGQTGYAKNEFILPDGRCWVGLSAFLSAKKGEKAAIVKDGLSGYTYVKKADGCMGFLPSGVLK